MKRTMNLLWIMFVLTSPFNVQGQQNANSLELLSERIESLEKELLLQKRFKFSGYIQTQMQYGEEFAQLKVGDGNASGDRYFNRFGIRRGRTKLEYKNGNLSSLFQLDITEKGVGVKDASFAVNDTWKEISSLKLGVFDRPFGYEISYSSSARESPERASVITTLFPEERDLGAMFTLQSPSKYKLANLKLQIAVISGNGIKKDIDSYKDIIGRISFKKQFPTIVDISGGLSYYNGGVYQGSSTLFEMSGNSFVKDEKDSNLKSFAKREYFGVDVQFSFPSSFGVTKLFSEYLFGQQPGEKSSSKSPNYSVLPTNDVYLRRFKGYYLTFVHNFKDIPFSVVAKYDFYNPNIKVTKNDIGLNGTGKGDIAYSTWGFGVFWTATNQVRVTAYYDWVVNEISSNLAGYENDVADNQFTVRLQYKF